MIKIEGAEREALIAHIETRIAADTQRIGSPERAAVWECGWAEALAKFRSDPREESLIPAFIHMDNPVRWQQEFWHPSVYRNELTHVREMQARIGAYMADCDHVAEFGCGTGFNLVALAKRFPLKTLEGLDSSRFAVDLVRAAAFHLKLPLAASQFDMLRPAYQSDFVGRGGAFTFGSVEQLAGRFIPFMEYLIAARPRVVVHVEPVSELYDSTNQIDALAIAFHRKRGYTTGLLPWLQNDPRVEMLHVERTGFGSLMIEGYNLIAWRPR